MQLPDRIDPTWIGTLDDGALADAERQLNQIFFGLERQEKERRGTQYQLLRGPAPLIDAWLRWSLVTNAARKRGLRLHYRG
jgi:hypothetical protein